MKQSVAHSRASFRCEFDAIHDAMAQIAGFADSARLHNEDAIKLQLVIEELMTNSIRHGKPSKESQIDIELSDCANTIRIDYADEGLAFDPTSYQPPSPEDQQDAGYGWVLIRGICKEIGYERSKSSNRTYLSLPIAVNRQAR